MGISPFFQIRSYLGFSTLFLLIVQLSAAQPAPVSPIVPEEAHKKAETSFRDLYGKDFDKATAAPAKAKVDFAQKLQKAADKVASDPPLKLVIQEKAVALVAGVPAGSRLAADLYPALIAGVEDKAPRYAAYIQLLEKMLPAEPAATKLKLVTDMLMACRDAAVIQIQKDNGQPQPLFDKAKKLNKAYSLAAKPETKDLVRDIERLEKDYEKSQGAQRELARLKAAFARAPEDSPAVLALAYHYHRENQPAEVQRIFAECKVPSLNAVAAAQAKKLPDREVAVLLRAAADELKGEVRLLWILGVQSQKAALGRCAATEKLVELRTLAGFLEHLITGDAGGVRSRWVEEYAECLGEQVEALQAERNPTEANAVLGKLRNLANSNYRGAELKDLLALIDAKVRDIEKGTSLEDEARALEAKVKATPNDFASHQALGLILLQLRRSAEAAPHLVKAERKELRVLGELLLANKPNHLELGKAYREAAGDRATWMNALARKHYQLAIQENSKMPDIDRVRLLVSQLPPSGAGFADEIRSFSARSVLVLFDEGEPSFFKYPLTQGNAKPAIENRDAYSGRSSMKCIAPGYGFVDKDIRIEIAETPKTGQYRHVKFAWKKVGGTEIALGLHTAKGVWLHYVGAPALPEFLKPYSNIIVGARAPAGWEVVTRDLFADLGEATIDGMSFHAVTGGADYALFDFMVFAQTPGQLERATPIPRK